MKTPQNRKIEYGFTLIELLTVIAIIGILAAIIIPTVAQVRKSARNATCVSNLRQLGVAVFLYAADNKDKLPTGWVSSAENWMTSLINPKDYVGNGKSSLTPLKDQRKGMIFFCPTNLLNASSPSTSDATTSYGWNHYGLLNKTLNGSDHPTRLALISETKCSGNNWPNLLVEGNGSVIKMDAAVHGTHANVLYLDGHVGKVTEQPLLTDNLFWSY